MADDGFSSALSFVLKWEGGLSDDPDDPGGRTNRGITQLEYDKWRDQQGLVHRDVALLADPEVNAIYQANYWHSAHCNALPLGEDLLHFDTSVNMGVRRATRFLQAAAGTRVDGVFGPLTLKAVSGTGPDFLISSYCSYREAYYRALAKKDPRLGKFLGGWLNRLNAVRRRLGIAEPEGEEDLSFGLPEHAAKIPDYGIDSKFDF